MDEKFITREQLEQFGKDFATQLSKGLTDNLGEIVEGAVVKRLNSLGISEEDFKAGKIPAKFLPGGDGKDPNELTPVQKTASFVKAVLAKDISKLHELGSKAMGETDGSLGGFLVPEEVAAAIYRIAEDFGLVRKFATRFPMSTDTLSVPRLGSTVTVSWGTENTNNTASDWSLQSVQLLIKDLIGLAVVSNGLLADANVNVVQQLLALFAEAIAGEEDNQGLTGSGSPFIGVLSDAGVNVVTMDSGKDTFAEIALKDFINLTVNVKPWALQGAGFIMHRVVWGLALQIQEGSQSIIAFAQAAIAGNTEYFGIRPAGTILGYPVWLSDKMPSVTAVSTKFVIFGNLRHVFLGDRQQLMMDVSPHATVGSINTFAANSSALRVVERVAVAVGLPAAFSVLKTAAS